MKRAALILCASFLLWNCKKESAAPPSEPIAARPADPPVAPGTTEAPVPPVPPVQPIHATAWVDPGADSPVPVQKAVAVLAPTKGNQVAGVLTFEQTDKGLKLHSEVSGLPPGKHAYHIHLLGDCTSADGNKAGTHFHFTGSAKTPGEGYPHITGDLGDLDAGADGKATHDAVIADGQLHGKFSVLGRSVIVHEKPNDPKAPPLGGAGGRLACGVIGLTE